MVWQPKIQEVFQINGNNEKKQFTLKIQSQYHIVFAQNIDEKRYKAK